MISSAAPDSPRRRPAFRPRPHGPGRGRLLGCLIGGLILSLAGCTGTTNAGDSAPPATPRPVGTAAATPLRPEPPPLAWIELAPDGRWLARAITSGPACPAITLGGQTQPLQQRGTVTPPDFPTLVCELPIPPGTTSVAVAGQALRLPGGTPSRIAVIGDTGCRLKSGDGFQACNDPQQWEFPAIARSIAAWQPDLVIHVGDYVYRESPCPAGDSGCAGSPVGDQWAAWNADFFTPAAPLLRTAPWLALRGNHEVCSRNGAGWFRLLDPHPMPAACQDYTDPYAVTLGNLQLLVLDTATATDQSAPADQVSAYTQQFATLRRLAGPNAWLVAHKPIWSVLGQPNGAPLAIHNATLLAAAGPALPAGIKLALAGHIHLAEALSFQAGRPPQLVVGESGSRLDPPIGPPLAGLNSDGVPLAAGTTLHQTGYLTLERTGPTWQATFRAVTGAAQAICTLQGAGLTCGP
ncbi:MAG TPA: metallophosphoesterase [Chloroflexia bacterium]|nr:metallophosphoesterase [Chloroflexia bacterium]